MTGTKEHAEKLLAVRAKIAAAADNPVRLTAQEADQHFEAMFSNDELQQLWQEGIDSGLSEEGRGVFARLRQRYRADAWREIAATVAAVQPTPEQAAKPLDQQEREILDVVNETRAEIGHNPTAKGRDGEGV